jgi:DNA-binding XRE family transcriptional regulator
MRQEIESHSDFTYNPSMGKQDKIDFASICKQLRMKGKWTQQEMANILGVSLRNYQKWEAGTAKPNAEAAYHLCEMQQEIQSKQFEKDKKN